MLQVCSCGKTFKGPCDSTHPPKPFLHYKAIAYVTCTERKCSSSFTIFIDTAGAWRKPTREELKRAFRRKKQEEL